MDDWSVPHFGPIGAAVLTLLAAWFVVRIARSPGTTARRRAEIESRPDGRLRFHRRYVLSWWLVAAVALTPLLSDPDLRPDDYGLIVPRPAGIAFAAALFAVFVALVLLRGRLARRRPPQAPPRVAFLLPRTARERRWGVATAFTAGICEEVVFRGAFLAAAVGLLHLSLPLAALATSLFFGLGHLYQGLPGVLATTLFGLVATGLYVFTGSLLLSVLLHAAVDLVPFALNRYEPAPAEPSSVG